MNLPLRQQNIVEEVRRRGYLGIKEMTQMSAVAPQTIRRGINQFAGQGPLRRYHGGAACGSSIESTVYTMRTGQIRDEKQRIAEAVASLVPDNASLSINIDTTTEAIAHTLLNHRNLKIIINSLYVVATFNAEEDFGVLVTGSAVRSGGNTVGQTAAGFIQQFRVDFALVGTSGIDEDGSLLDFDYQEVRVSQTIIDNARQVFSAADSNELGCNAVVRLGPISLVNRIINDSPSPAATTRLMAQHEARLSLV